MAYSNNTTRNPHIKKRCREGSVLRIEVEHNIYAIRKLLLRLVLMYYMYSVRQLRTLFHQSLCNLVHAKDIIADSALNIRQERAVARRCQVLLLLRLLHSTVQSM